MANRFDVAVLHDFFVDRLVYVQSVKGLAKDLRSKSAEGGGGIHGMSQSEVSGGNAVNLARGLGRLGRKVLLITHSDSQHMPILEKAMDGLDVELRVKPLRPGLTVAIEGEVNVMLGDCGGAATFGPGELSDDDWGSLARADLVCSVNWAANERGTELLKALRRRLGRKRIFLDPADFRDRPSEFASLLREISKRHLVDWVSVNEEEAKAAAMLLGVRATDLGEACRRLASNLGVTLDLHGVSRSWTSDGGALASRPCLETRPRRLTGAGDAWDAGSICGWLEGMGDEARVAFANAAASVFLGREENLQATHEEVERRLSESLLL